MSVRYVTLTFTGADQDGEIDCPVLDEPTPDVIAAAARRAFWTLVHNGYGDVDEVNVYHAGVLVMGAAKVRHAC